MAKTIMIQGTMSNAGKSLITAGLCRIFMQDGYKVAPFKSQNMALNSFITDDGLEMGRAQVMQAEAAGTVADVRMNPILLKPTNDTGSQLIVNGEVRGVMSAVEYFKYKHELIPDIMNAFNTLSEENDIIVIEGAGSPAEINLKEEDIVNMGMAKMANAPVLLVGDIDRGGVFAQLIGTMDLLEPDERAMVKGLIINKFRGDKTILDPGIELLENKAAVPVVGVAPYMNIDVEDEDSLSERLSVKDSVCLIDVAVIRLPRISNFTDLNALEAVPGVSVRYCSNVSELRKPDMIVVPGSKNTISDLMWMRSNGLEAAVKKCADAGILIFGICGGYQILGETISDPLGIETSGDVRGMGLLPVDTVFESEKTRTRVTGTFKTSGSMLSALADENISAEGYEIHMGISTLRNGAKPFAVIKDSVSGNVKEDGAYKDNVFGSYMHGVFDGVGIASRIAGALAKHKGIELEDDLIMSYAQYKETQYDLLAENLRNHLDMDRIYDILNNGI